MASQYKWDKARIDTMRGGQDSSEQMTLENPWDRCFQIFLEHTAYRDMTFLSSVMRGNANSGKAACFSK